MINARCWLFIFFWRIYCFLFRRSIGFQEENKMQLLKFNRTLFCAAAISGAMGLGAQADAVASTPPPPGYCSTATATEGISVGNTKINGISANDCYGVASGNITGSGTYDGAPVLNALNWGPGWTYLDATDEASAPFNGLTFTVTATPGSSGTWTMTGTDTNGSTSLNFPATLDFVVGLKGGSEYALWAFDNVLVDGSDNGTFSIVFTNKGGNNPALSHMIIFGREGSVAAVPEADTYAMLLAGLGLVGFAVRRKLI
jgi:hypothetical protein